MRPRGTPPIPTATSRLKEVVEIAGISETSRSPRRIIDPFPNLFSIFDNAASIALPRSMLIRSSAITYISFFRSFSHEPRQNHLLFAVGLPLRITHSTREWNSVSCLQQEVFPGEGWVLKVPVRHARAALSAPWCGEAARHSKRMMITPKGRYQLPPLLQLTGPCGVPLDHKAKESRRKL